MDTILLPSAGGLTGVYLARHFKKSRDCRIVATDMTSINALYQWVDAFYSMPAIKDDSYTKKLLEVCEKESIEYIFPITSRDVDFFAQEKIATLFHSYRFISIDEEMNTTLSNKKSCYGYLKEIGFNTPQVFGEDNLIFPAVLKPQRGSGSKNTYILENQIDYNYWKQKFPDSFLSQFIEGAEYTVDALFDLEGKALGYNVRERVKVVSGGATVTKNNPFIDVRKEIALFESLKRIKGPFNFQFKLSPRNEIIVFDVNTRLASGGLPLTVASGLDIPNLVIDLLKNEIVSKWQLPKEKSRLTMVRYYQEFFLNE